MDSPAGGARFARLVGVTGRALVVGGGIGGLAVAAGLVRAGWRVTVVERAEAFSPVGAGITVAPNGVKAMDWLGLGVRLRERATASGAAGLRTATGRWLMRTQVEAVRARFGEPAFALHRADLHRLLLAAVEGAELRTGQDVTGVDRNGEVTVDGTRQLAADVVIGADGLNSTVRRLLFPAYPGPAFAGYVAWRGVVAADAAQRIGVPVSVAESWGRGQRFGIVPLADGRVYWYATALGPPGTGQGDDLTALAARFAGWHDPIPALLAATAPDTLLRHGIAYLRDPLPSYVDGRVVLVGDAAHAMTPDLGQGGNLALEDAATLVAALTATPDVPADVPAALHSYDAARRTRTQHLVRVSAHTGRLVQPSSLPGTVIRDLVAALIPARVALRASDEALGWTPPR